MFDFRSKSFAQELEIRDPHKGSIFDAKTEPKKKTGPVREAGEVPLTSLVPLPSLSLLIPLIKVLLPPTPRSFSSLYISIVSLSLTLAMYSPFRHTNMSHHRISPDGVFISTET